VVLNDLVTDRQRDRFQSHLIFHLVNNRHNNRNRLPLLEALISGENVSKQEIFECLCEDLVLDRITDEIVSKIICDHVQNRNVDEIIENLVSGQPHLPSPNENAIEYANIRTDKAFAKLARKITHPHAIKKLVKTGIIEDLMDYLASCGSNQQMRGVGSGNRPLF